MSPQHSISLREDYPGGYCALTYTPLDIPGIVASVQCDGAGANAIFIGTTRDTFQDKTVAHLEYQAYSKLAIATMHAIVQEALGSGRVLDVAHRVLRCTVVHRLGVVPVGEASVAIAVSSPHRKEAFDACERILEEVKAKAQIWKCEIYTNASALWKSNDSR